MGEKYGEWVDALVLVIVILSVGFALGFWVRGEWDRAAGEQGLNALRHEILPGG